MCSCEFSGKILGFGNTFSAVIEFGFDYQWLSKLFDWDRVLVVTLV